MTKRHPKPILPQIELLQCVSCLTDGKSSLPITQAKHLHVIMILHLPLHSTSSSSQNPSEVLPSKYFSWLHCYYPGSELMLPTPLPTPYHCSSHPTDTHVTLEFILSQRSLSDINWIKLLLYAKPSNGSPFHLESKPRSSSGSVEL